MIDCTLGDTETTPQPRVLFTKGDLTEKYRKKLGVEFYGQDELVCTYKTKTMTKALFITEIFDRATCKKFIEIKNKIGSDKIVVYCMYAYYHSDTAEIVVNRAE